MREILKAFTKTTSGTIISLLFSTITVKILAVLLGPSSIGLLSLLRQIYNTTLIAATVSGQTALVQGGSAREGSERIAYLRTVLLLFLFSSFVSAVALWTASPLLAQWILNRQDNSAVWLVRLLSLPLVFTVINGFLMGILNIQRRLGRMAVIQMIASGLTASLAYPIALLVKEGYEIALLGTVLLVPLITFGMTVYSIHETGMLIPLLQSIHRNVRWDLAKSFYSFAGITVITAVIQSVVMLLIRSLIVDQEGLANAGIFDAAWVISMTYISLVTTAFGTYYLPSLSSAVQTSHKLDLMQRMFRFVTVMSVPLIVGVVVLKPVAIQLLFSSEFLPAITLMGWMLIGDFFKLTSWVKAYPMLAFAELRLFLVSELIFQSVFFGGVAFSMLVLQRWEGIAVTFCVAYVLYYIAVSIYASKRHGFVTDNRTKLSWWLGLGCVLVFSAFTWSATEVNWVVVVAAVFAMLAYGVFSFNRHEISSGAVLLRLKLKQVLHTL